MDFTIYLHFKFIIFSNETPFNSNISCRKFESIITIIITISIKSLHKSYTTYLSIFPRNYNLHLTFNILKSLLQRVLLSNQAKTTPLTEHLMLPAPCPRRKRNSFGSRDEIPWPGGFEGEAAVVQKNGGSGSAAALPTCVVFPSSRCEQIAGAPCTAVLFYTR